MPWMTKPRPAGFDRLTDKLVLTGTSPDVVDGDTVCAKYSSKWWIDYQKKREKQLYKSLETSLFAKPFTRYPSFTADGTALRQLTPNVPVEAFLGERFGPNGLGWTQGLWGCYFACQDIRTTYEWVLGFFMTVRGDRGHGPIQVRAKWTYGFHCPKGMISETYVKHSRREAETDEEIMTAFRMLAEIMKKTSLEFPGNNIAMFGEIGLIKGCRCVHPGPGELDEAREDVFRDIQDHRPLTVRDVYIAGQEPRLDSKRRASMGIRKTKRIRNILSHTCRAANDVAESSGTAEERANSQTTGSCDDDQFEIPDELPEPKLDMPTPFEDTMTCFDFDYPELGMDYGLPDTLQEDQPDVDPDYRTVLSAFLDDFADFDNFEPMQANGKRKSPDS